MRRAVQGRIRYRGRLHEWCPVGRAHRYKDWGIFMEQLKAIRTPTKTTGGINPLWVHGGKGSGIAHRQILNLIDAADDYPTFLRGLRRWLFDRMRPQDRNHVYQLLEEWAYLVKYRP